jgi:hypothetical protein
VLSVSRSRVYELLYAEQVDSVKIGRSRRGLVSRGCGRTVRRRHELSWRQSEGARRLPPATCGPTNRPTRPASP